MDFFENEGVPLKTERGNRVFPVSDKALDIVDALFFYVKRLGVKFEFEHTVEKILTGEDGAVCGVQADGKTYEADRVIVATAAHPIRRPVRPATAIPLPRHSVTRSCLRVRLWFRWLHAVTCARS